MSSSVRISTSTIFNNTGTIYGTSSWCVTFLLDGFFKRGGNLYETKDPKTPLYTSNIFPFSRAGGNETGTSPLTGHASARLRRHDPRRGREAVNVVDIKLGIKSMSFWLKRFTTSETQTGKT